MSHPHLESKNSLDSLTEVHGHMFKRTKLKKFTWCDLCGDFIWGMTDPLGYKCQVCDVWVHKKCLREADTMHYCGETFAKQRGSKHRDKKSIKKIEGNISCELRRLIYSDRKTRCRNRANSRHCSS